MSDLVSRRRLVLNHKKKVIEMNIDFAVRDPDGNEVGRIRQDQNLSEAMRQLILASAASVDMALKQDSRGLS